MNDENKKKILVVDDNHDLNTVLVDKLVLSGFEAQGAGDGEEGLKKALEWHPDVILLDIVMPKMDGIALLGKLRDDPWGKECKVIVLSLIEEADYIVKTMEYNVFGYVVKTDYSLDGLVEKIKSAVDSTKKFD